MEPRATIGRNFDTCRPGLLEIKLMGYEHWEDALGGGTGNGKHTHTHTVSLVIHRMDVSSGNVRTQS